MKARLVHIGDSRGIRLPESLIEQAGIIDEVVLKVSERAIVIRPVTTTPPRAGWAEAARRLHEREADGLLDPGSTTLFDETEWVW